jgi:LysM domain
MTAQTIQRTSHRAADVGRGFVALVGTLVLVVGVPVALVTWVGSPLPAEVPTLDEVSGALRDTYIPESFLVKALALVCWLVWTELLVSLIVEAIAYVRGRKAGSVPLAGGVQRWAARLIATTALLGALVATRNSSGTATQTRADLIPTVQPVSTLVVDDDLGRRATRDTEVPVAPSGPAPVYEVQRRDTLWDIAERHLGDPFRWQEIFRLNQGKPQADGTCLTDPDLIYVGWKLELPPDAYGVGPAPAPPVEAPPAPPPAPKPDGGSSRIIDGGMVLIDDDGGSGGSGVILAGERGQGGASGTAVGDRAAASGGAGGGMVLLPDDPPGGGPVSDEPPVLAGPDTGGSPRNEHDDELAGESGGSAGPLWRTGDERD